MIKRRTNAMTMNEIIGVVLLSILIYLEAYALVGRICNCIERCFYAKYGVLSKEVNKNG